jgi:imidazolonepropionase-like amidohydrolase
MRPRSRHKSILKRHALLRSARFIGALGIGALVLGSHALAADVLIERVTVLSPEQAKPSPNRYVLVRDGRIAAIGDQKITASANATHVDGRGKFLVPGLMDSHVHVSDPIGIPYFSPDPAVPGLKKAYYQQQPRSCLYFGVTQLLDLNNTPDGIAAFESQPRHPDLFRCGSAPALDGYPTLFIDDKSIRYRVFPFVYEPANAQAHPLPPGEDANAHTPEAVVARIAASGARCVKLFIEDGFGEASNWPILSRATMQQVVAAAHKKGLLVIAHANALDMQRLALDAQVDVIAHGLWNWNEFSDKPGIPAPIAAHLQAIHRARIGYQPTFRVMYGLADLFREDTLKDPMYAKVVPAALLRWYGTPDGQWYKREMREAYKGAPDMKIMHWQIETGDQGMRAAAYLYGLGHPLLLSTDTPSAPTFGNQPGYDTYREMRLMAQDGIPLAAIFQAGTINNARQFRLDKDYGTLAVGKVANLLLLNANPLESVRAWSMIDKVVLHGEVIERESLKAN